MADTEAKKLLGNLWASAATADRTDPDDSTLNPTLTRTEGWPDSFSVDQNPRRAVMNQRFRELDGAASGAMTMGIELWDSEVDYPQHGLTNSGGTIYRATVATGPATSNATDPASSGQTVWDTVSGTTGRPSAPDAPQASASASGELDWFWNCPLDNGAEVTEFDFRWRTAGQTSWQPTVTVSTARNVLTGLTNGTAVEAEVLARNSVGDSAWSSTGSATPSGEVPGGGSEFALRADPGDASGEVDTDWLEPDDGGLTITSYTLQWREDGQSFSTSRQTTGLTSTQRTVTGLTNGTLHHFRVRAVNSEGNGAWSDSASATPRAPAAPDAPGAPTLTGRRPLTVDIKWPITDDDGDSITTHYDARWRYTGGSWTQIDDLEETCTTITIADTTNGVEAQARAVNANGDSGWSAVGSISQSDLEDDSAALTYREFVAPGTTTFTVGEQWSGVTGITFTIWAVVSFAPSVAVGGTTYQANTATDRLQSRTEGGERISTFAVTGLTDSTSISVTIPSGNRAIDGSFVHISPL